MLRIIILPLITGTFTMAISTHTVRIDSVIQYLVFCDPFVIHSGLATENLGSDMSNKSVPWRGVYIYFYAPLNYRISGQDGDIDKKWEEIDLLTSVFTMAHYKSLKCLYVLNYVNPTTLRKNISRPEIVTAELEISKFLASVTDRLIKFPGRGDIKVGTVRFFYLLWIHHSLMKPPYTAVSHQLIRYRYVFIKSIDTMEKGKIIYLLACYTCKILSLVKIPNSKIPYVLNPFNRVMQEEAEGFKIIWKFIAKPELTKFSGILSPKEATMYLRNIQNFRAIDPTLFVAALLLHLTNSTGRICPNQDDFGMTQCESEILGEDGKIRNHVNIGLELLDEYYPTYDWVSTSSTGYTFMTCWSQIESPYKYYVTPYGREVWISILLAGFLTSLFLIGLLRIKKNLSVPPSYPVILLISTLLEETFHVPTILWKQEEFRSVVHHIYYFLQWVYRSFHNEIILSIGGIFNFGIYRFGNTALRCCHTNK